ncbi:hypothetical protein ACWD4G_32735 [Streptomyces sp. NPDC002643]
MSEQSEERAANERVEEPPGFDGGAWWGPTGLVGGALFTAIGAGAAVWLVLRGTDPDGAWAGYYVAAKILAVGLVVSGTLLVTRIRSRKR